MIKYPNLILDFPFKPHMYSHATGDVNNYYVDNPADILWYMIRYVVPVN